MYKYTFIFVTLKCLLSVFPWIINYLKPKKEIKL